MIIFEVSSLLPMKKYEKAALSIAFLTILLSGGLTAGFVGIDADVDDEAAISREEKVLDTFENDDYDGWKKIISRNSNIGNMISREDFENFVAARRLTRKGEYERAIQLAEGLEEGLKKKIGQQYLI